VAVTEEESGKEQKKRNR